MYLDDDDDDDDEQQQQEQEGEADVVVVEGTAPEPESQTSKAHPSSGTATKQRRATYSYKVAAASKAKAKPKGNKTILEMLRKTPEELVMKGVKGVFSQQFSPAQRPKSSNIMWICNGPCGFMSVAYHSIQQQQDNFRLQLRQQRSMVQGTSLLLPISQGIHCLKML